MLAETLAHYRRQQRITTAAVLAARRLRSQGDDAVAETVAAFQVAAARDGAASVPSQLAEQGIGVDPEGLVVPERLAGTASDGRPLASLFEQATSQYAFELMVTTMIQDAARGAASVAIAARPRVGYARMLNPPSCSRCALLAGRFYRWNTGFQRHPKCDCRHIPSTEAFAGDLTTDPNAYFESLPTAESLKTAHPDLTVAMRKEAGLYSREDIFGSSGSRAIEDGADISQVVNARRGMQSAQVFGRDLVITTEGTTSRGFAFNALSNRGTRQSAEEFVTRNTRNGPEERRVTRTRAAAPRVMPESIYELAGNDRAEALRLLEINGFIVR